MNVLTSFFLIVVLAVVLLPDSDGFTLCKTFAKTEACKHGTTKDYCGNVVCAKGPGQRCGGPSNMHGRCGEGMHCRCETCTGCSLNTLDCHRTVGRPTCF